MTELIYDRHPRCAPELAWPHLVEESQRKHRRQWHFDSLSFRPGASAFSAGDSSGIFALPELVKLFPNQSKRSRFPMLH